MSETLLRLDQVIARTGLKSTSIYERMAAGTFPRSAPIGSRARAWAESEIEAWIQSNLHRRKQEARP